MPLIMERNPTPTSYVRMLSSLQDVIAAVAESRLIKSSYAEVRGLSVEVHADTVLLRGRVSSYYLKQVAQSLVGGVSGVEEIDNQVCVTPSPGRGVRGPR
jgi:osmotically-inducible protein OsmY